MAADGTEQHYLERAQTGDRFARETVYKFTLCRLRAIASALLSRERPGHTLQPTALVSELFLKLHRIDANPERRSFFPHFRARDAAGIDRPLALSQAP